MISKLIKLIKLILINLINILLFLINVKINIINILQIFFFVESNKNASSLFNKIVLKYKIISIQL